MNNPKIVYNKLLSAWFVVRGPHCTPISGAFKTREAAKAWLAYRRDPYGHDATFWKDAI